MPATVLQYRVFDEGITDPKSKNRLSLRPHKFATEYAAGPKCTDRLHYFTMGESKCICGKYPDGKKDKK